MIACVTKSTELTIEDAAKQKSEALYSEIKAVDLIAKEFRYHCLCYKNVTKMKPTNILLNETMTSDQEESASNFEKVVEMIKENILYYQQARFR